MTSLPVTLLPSSPVEGWKNPWLPIPSTLATWEHVGFAGSLLIHSPLVFNIPFCRKAEVSPFTWSLSSSLLHPLSSPRPKHSGVQYALNESSWWDSEANNSITEPSTRQEPCLGTIQSWGLLNPHAGFVTIFARLGDYVMCLRTQLGSSEMGSRGQVFCLPYLVFTQHSIISTFFPQHSNDQKKR